jgi:hypothetical protein
MPFPETVDKSPVHRGKDVQLIVWTTRIAHGYWQTVIVDDSEDRRHEGMVLAGHECEGRTFGPWTIGEFTVLVSTHDDAMEQHREALHAARTTTPKAPQRKKTRPEASPTPPPTTRA